MDIDVDLLMRISLGVDHLSIIQRTFFFFVVSNDVVFWNFASSDCCFMKFRIGSQCSNKVI